jgi:hypothetical protein
VGSEFDPLNSKEVVLVSKKCKFALPETVEELLSNYGAFTFEKYDFFTPIKPYPKWYSQSNKSIVGTFFGKLNKKFRNRSAC